MFNKENFLGASFTSEENTHVEVLYKHEDGKTHPFVIDINDVDHPNTKELFNIIDLETIQMMTAQRIREERESFEKMVMGIAKRDGIIVDPKDLPLKEPEVSTAFDLIFKEHNYEDEKIKEQLFKCKLIAFELDEVKNSKKRKIKTELRTAKTFKEVLEVILKFY